MKDQPLSFGAIPESTQKEEYTAERSTYFLPPRRPRSEDRAAVAPAPVWPTLHFVLVRVVCVCVCVIACVLLRV